MQIYCMRHEKLSLFYYVLSVLYGFIRLLTFYAKAGVHRIGIIHIGEKFIKIGKKHILKISCGTLTFRCYYMYY